MIYNIYDQYELWSIWLTIYMIHDLYRGGYNIGSDISFNKGKQDAITEAEIVTL